MSGSTGSPVRRIVMGAVIYGIGIMALTHFGDRLFVHTFILVLLILAVLVGSVIDHWSGSAVIVLSDVVARVLYAL